MSEFAYRPRFGFDIRVRPPVHQEANGWAAGTEHACAAPGCTHKAVLRLGKSPREPHVKVWLCAAHAQVHNAGWNFFDGLSAHEAEKVRADAIYGDRPTWSMARNGRASAAAHARGPSDFRDAFGLFTGATRRFAASGPMRNGRLVPKLATQAFETLGLRVTAAGPEIRRRFRDLVRRYHPDANGGDRGAEAQLASVVKAHQILKKAGYC
jgi:hypothetical protein